MGADYIGDSDADFNDFQNNFVAQLTPANVLAWDLDTTEVTNLKAYQTTWVADYAAGGKAASTTRNEGLTKAKTDARVAYETSESPQPMGLRAFINARIAYNNLITDANRVLMNVPVHTGERHAHTVATKNKVIFKSVGIGGGDVLTECWPSGTAVLNPSAATSRTAAHSNRPHKEDKYEIRTSYSFIKIGGTQPTDPTAVGMTMVVDTKARIVRHLGAAAQGMVLCEFKQWHNPKHPDLDGPWTGSETCYVT
jgi:hypothetical protein